MGYPSPVGYFLLSDFMRFSRGGTYFVMVGALRDIHNLTMEMKLIKDQQEQENFWRIPKIILLLLVVYRFHFNGWILNVLDCFNHDEIGSPRLCLTKSNPKNIQFTNKITKENIFFCFSVGYPSPVGNFLVSDFMRLSPEAPISSWLKQCKTLGI